MKIMHGFIKKLLSKLPVPYLAILCIGVLARAVLMSSDVKERLFGPTWGYQYNADEETAVFHTETDLKSGKITVQYQLELEYEGIVFYILEIQGLYNINQVELSKSDTSGIKRDVDEQESKFCLALESQQSDKLKNFRINLEELLEGRFGKKYGKKFKVEKFEIQEMQIAEIHYQSSQMNKSEPMYVFVSEEETSTVNEREVIIRSPHAFINLDELNLEESFYTNEEIMTIAEDCADKIKMSLE